MADGRKVTDLEVGWRVRLRCKSGGQFAREPRLCTVEGTLQAVAEAIPNADLEELGRVLRVRDDDGKNHWIHEGRVLRAQRVLGSLESRRRVRDEVVA